MRRLWPDLRRSLLLRVHLIRHEALHLRARSALAAATGGHGDHQRRLEQAGGDARRLAREGLEWSQACARLVLAGVYAAQGNHAAAEAEAARAVDGFVASGLAAYGAAARRRLGELQGGERGARVVADADAWFRAQGAANPERMTAMLAPGFRA